MLKLLKENIARRRIAIAIAATFLPLSGTLAQSAHLAGPGGYPHNCRVVVVVPFAPGGATDIVARLVADELTKRWGTTVVVDNKPGAGGGIGTEFVARSKADGHTLLLGTQTALAVSPNLVKRLGYNVERDFKAVHVPYKGSSQSLVDLAGNQIDMQFDNMTTALAFARNGQAKALAVTSLVRSEIQPDLPTLAESGVPEFEAVTWLGLLAPAGTPAPLVSWLNKEVVAVLEAPSVKAKLAAQGFTPRPMSPEGFRKFIQDETVKFAELIKANNITVE